MAMHYNKLLIQAQGSVAIIRLNDPDKLNATSYAMLEELDHAFSTLSQSAGAIILTGAGRAFCSGAGLESLQNDAADIGIGLETHVNPLLNKLRGLKVPWISAVRGAAAGLGCSLALAADLIVVSESAFFIESFARVGLVPDGGSTYLLTRGLTRVRAMEMALLAEKVGAQQALAWGLINRVVPDNDLEQAALDIAGRLARGAPLALRMIRQAMWDVLDSNWEAALRAEREAQRSAGGTADFAEGLAAFLEKRAPAFKGT